MFEIQDAENLDDCHCFGDLNKSHIQSQICCLLCIGQKQYFFGLFHQPMEFIKENKK